MYRYPTLIKNVFFAVREFHFRPPMFQHPHRDKRSDDAKNVPILRFNREITGLLIRMWTLKEKGAIGITKNKGCILSYQPTRPLKEAVNLLFLSVLKKHMPVLVRRTDRSQTHIPTQRSHST